MPFMQAMASRVNTEFSGDNLQAIDPDTFAQPGSLVSGLQSLGIVQSTAEANFLDSFPSGLKESVRAVLHDNLNPEAGNRLGVTVAWSPAYEDQVKIFQVADGEHSDGGITILVRSRYPSDRGAPGTGIK